MSIEQNSVEEQVKPQDAEGTTSRIGMNESVAITLTNIKTGSFEKVEYTRNGLTIIQGRDKEIVNGNKEPK